LEKTLFISDLAPGNSVDDVFVIRDVQLQSKKNGDPYLSFTLIDKTGEIKGVAWDRAPDFNDALKDATYVHINGRVSKYNDTLQFTTNCVPGIQLVASGDVNPGDFMPVTERDIDDMFVEIMQTIEEEIQLLSPLRKLLNTFFIDDPYFVDMFKAAPGGKRMHHAYIGGLLEHTWSMLGIAEAAIPYYQMDNSLNAPLLFTGIILHDIGKIYEYQYEVPPINFSDEGRLLGHIPIGLQMLGRKLEEIPSFPDDLAIALKHMIISHHGRKEWGSPEPPKTLEAVILHHLDLLDGNVAAVKGFMDKQQGFGWTPYHQAFGRYFYKP